MFKICKRVSGYYPLTLRLFLSMRGSLCVGVAFRAAKADPVFLDDRIAVLEDELAAALAMVLYRLLDIVNLYGRIKVLCFGTVAFGTYNIVLVTVEILVCLLEAAVYIFEFIICQLNRARRAGGVAVAAFDTAGIVYVCFPAFQVQTGTGTILYAQ